MLTLRRDMLLPDGIQESLIKFMDDIRGVGEDTGHSKARYITITSVNDVMHYHEGYLNYRASGEVRIRANTIAYSRQMHLYAWDKVVAMLPSNKSIKKIWVHPNIESMLPKFDTRSHYYNRYYKERIQEYLHITQQA